MKGFLQQLRYITGFVYFRIILPWSRFIWKFTIYRWSQFKTYRWYGKIISIIYSLFHTLVVYVIAVMLNFLWLFGNMPGVNRLDNPQLALASEVYSADGVLLGKFFRENREPVKYKEIGKPVIDALIVTEDVRFYKHNGVDIRGTLGAAYQTARGDKRGGSTITQQLAKNL